MKVRRGAIALTYAAMLFLLIGLITSCSTSGIVTHIYKLQGGGPEGYGLTLDGHPGTLYLFGGSASYQVGDRVTFSTHSASSDLTGIEIDGVTFNEIRIIEGNNQ